MAQIQERAESTFPIDGKERPITDSIFFCDTYRREMYAPYSVACLTVDIDIFTPHDPLLERVVWQQCYEADGVTPVKLYSICYTNSLEEAKEIFEKILRSGCMATRAWVY